HRDIDEVSHHRFHVAADISYLGELGRLHLHERRTRESRQTPRDLRLADTRRADEDDVVRHDLLAEIIIHALTPPAVAQSNRDRTLRVRLTDDVFVELRYDLARRQLVEPLLRGLLARSVRRRVHPVRFHSRPSRSNHSSSSTVIC